MTNTAIQQNKATQIENYFVDNPYVEFTTTDLHARFGPSFRSRVSEINRNPKRKVTIKNRTTNRRVYQSSVYWAEPVVKPEGAFEEMADRLATQGTVL